MRILFVSQRFPYVPCTDGFRLIAFNLLKHLSIKHEIHLISFLESQNELQRIPLIEKYCTSIETVLKKPGRSGTDSFVRILSKLYLKMPRRLSSEMQTKIYRALKTLNIELIHVEGLGIGQYLIKEFDLPKVIAIHDAQSWRIQQYIRKSQNFFIKLRHILDWLKIRKLELEVLRRFDGCVVVSPDDKQFIKSFLPELNVSVAANGVDCEYYKPYSSEAGSNAIIFTGNMSYPPNVDAVLYFYNDIFPLIRSEIPQVELLVVGADPTKEIEELSLDGQVTVTGFVKDIRPYFHRSSVFVCPLRIGTGIKNKILEAMAMGVPIVATSLSIRGIEISPQEHIIIADDPLEFAKKSVYLMKNRELRLSVARKARSFVETNHSWAATARVFENVYSHAITQRLTRS
ncbi:MAG: glycosyltransferase [Candidatus Hodarchaeota archaeon]